MEINKKIISSKISSGFIISIFLLLSNSLANAKSNETIVWQAGADYVAIVSTESGMDESNNHPAKLSQKDIYNLLKSIYLSEKDSGFFNIDLFDSNSSDDNEYLELFTREELRKISQPISKAFEVLKPNQEIVFSVSGSHESTLGKSKKYTTARIFHQDQKLQIIFGEIFVDIKKKYLRAGHSSDVSHKIDDKDLKYFRLRVGSRIKIHALPFDLITNKTHSLKIQHRERRDDWLVIDIASFKNKIKKHETIKIRKDNIVKDTSELQTHTKKLAEEQKELQQKVERLERNLQETNKSKTSESKSLEERLAELQKLHEKGFVNDELYDEKVRQLLKEL